jgi:hypothetical protein
MVHLDAKVLDSAYCRQPNGSILSNTPTNNDMPFRGGGQVGNTTLVWEYNGLGKRGGKITAEPAVIRAKK